MDVSIAARHYKATAGEVCMIEGLTARGASLLLKAIDDAAPEWSEKQGVLIMLPAEQLAPAFAAIVRFANLSAAGGEKNF
jgi:hypothetical protein